MVQGLHLIRFRRTGHSSKSVTLTVLVSATGLVCGDWCVRCTVRALATTALYFLRTAFRVHDTS
jgi:hypothetical protein